MKNKILAKFLRIMLLIAIILTILPIHNVRAAENEETEEFYDLDEFIEEEFKETKSKNEEEEKILMYDVKTGKTTEIDIDSINKKYENIDNLDIQNPIEIMLSAASEPITRASGYTLVSNTSVLPNRAIWRIDAEVYEKRLAASGVLVGPNLLLTNAHCVMNKDDGDNFFVDCIAYPGYRGGTSYKGLSSGWSQIIYPADWKSDDDWCLCILNDDIGNDAGWLTCYAYNSTSDLIKQSVQVVGYPKEPGNAVLQYYKTGEITRVNNSGYFFTSCIGTGGMSGGPNIDISTGFVIGLTKGYTKTEGASVLINPTNRNLISEYF